MDKNLDLSNVREVISRNYNLIQCGFEIFTTDGKSYFFVLESEKELKLAIKRLKNAQNNLIIYYDRPEEFPKEYQKNWIKGKITNFEYLMIINTFASRSLNSINQYPVFPWIIKDYSSKELDLHTKDPDKQKTIYRDLSKPIGAMNPKKEADALEKYENDLGEPYFNYGSHYSSAAVVMSYLIRLEPYTSLNMELQSGRFDQPDRLFNSIENSWHSCYNLNGDFRELIPEFFYFADFLTNKLTNNSYKIIQFHFRNKVDFGMTQNNKKCDNVQLPAWALTPQEFIYKHREALESEYVSTNLHHWIDLIFGYKQTGMKAIEAVNVFRHLSYEGAVNLSEITDTNEQKGMLNQIFHLGQTPSQLFKKEHPPREVISPSHRIYELISKNPPKAVANSRHTTIKNLSNNLELKERYDSESFRLNIVTFVMEFI